LVNPSATILADAVFYILRRRSLDLADRLGLPERNDPKVDVLRLISNWLFEVEEVQRNEDAAGSGHPTFVRTWLA
jgi:hypothetical protein